MRPLSYDPATVDRLPRLYVSRRLGTRDFDSAREGLLTWAIQRSFFRVTGPPVAPGSEVELRWLWWSFSCRVVSLIDEPSHTSFTYGTLPGHLERGEETFELARDADGVVRLTIEAHSEPATWWLRAIRPVVNLARIVITRRYYLRALRP